MYQQQKYEYYWRNRNTHGYIFIIRMMHIFTVKQHVHTNKVAAYNTMPPPPLPSLWAFFWSSQVTKGVVRLWNGEMRKILMHKSFPNSSSLELNLHISILRVSLVIGTFEFLVF